MADYQLTDTDVVIRTADQAFIPNAPSNSDWIEYQAWLVNGGVPDPYVEPPLPPPQLLTSGEQVLYDHENRLRVIEGQPPLTLKEFVETRNAT